MWIYDLADYRQMFDLSARDLLKKILDFPAGMSSFNAQMTVQGHQVISGDELYVLTPPEITQRTKAFFEQDEKNLTKHKELLVNPDEIDNIVQEWRARRQRFLEDYSLEQKAQRYLPMQLPHLPFVDQSFGLALCSDFLFHTQAHSSNPTELIGELCRVAHEVRVFPLMTEQGKMPNTLGPLMLHLQQQSFGVEVREVQYHQLRGGNAMMRIWATECVLS